jgi:ubiquinone/menaquinone biosynthesis C-methylase UbiE
MNWQIIWQRDTPKHSFRVLERNRVLNEALRGKVILDAGCGVGRLVERLSNTCHVAIGIDIEMDLLKKASPSIRNQIVRGSVEYLPFRDDIFDVVVFEEVVEHLHRPSKAIEDCHRALRKEGRLIISTPNAKLYSLMRFLLHTPFPSVHVKEYDISELHSLLMKTFRNTSIEGLNPYFPKFLLRKFPSLGIILLAFSTRIS